MPHKVATFFRSHTNSLDSTAPEKKKKNAAALPSGLTRTSTINQDGIISSSSSINSADTNSSMSNKRHSLNLNSPRTSSKSILQHVPAKLDMEMESPPPVLYGQPSTSSGALLSGILHLTISDENMAIESFGMKLAVDVKMKKPFHAHCAECTYQSTDLTSWTFVPASTTLQKGMLHIVNLFSYSKLT
jgi:arrestin-related trafficking adapter 1